MLGFALVGFGAWGRLHAAAITAATGARLVAIVSSTADGVARARAAFPDVDCSMDLAAVVARDDVQVVSVVTPNARHEALAIAALEAGKHVLLEKPMAVDSAACRRINDCAARSGRILNVAHELRMSAQYGRIREWIVAGRLGRPLSLHFSLFRRSFRSGERGWRYDVATVGSWLLEELVHFADLAAWYFEDLGPVAGVSAVGNARSGTAGLYDSMSMRLRWSDGAYAVLSQTLAGFEHHKVLEVMGTAGAARALWSGVMDRTDAPAAALHLLEGLSGEERFEVGSPTAFALDPLSGEVTDLHALVEAVVAGIVAGRPVISGAAGARAVAICEAAERSMRDGVEVAVEAA